MVVPSLWKYNFPSSFPSLSSILNCVSMKWSAVHNFPATSLQYFNPIKINGFFSFSFFFFFWMGRLHSTALSNFISSCVLTQLRWKLQYNGNFIPQRVLGLLQVHYTYHQLAQLLYLEAHDSSSSDGLLPWQSQNTSKTCFLATIHIWWKCLLTKLKKKTKIKKTLLSNR